MGQGFEDWREIVCFHRDNCASCISPVIILKFNCQLNSYLIPVITDIYIMLKAFNPSFMGTLAFVFAFGIFLTTGVGIAKADYLVQGGKITNVQNTSSNGDNYAVNISGGLLCR